jgi:hypothetical protein
MLATCSSVPTDTVKPVFVIAPAAMNTTGFAASGTVISVVPDKPVTGYVPAGMPVIETGLIMIPPR